MKKAFAVFLCLVLFTGSAQAVCVPVVAMPAIVAIHGNPVAVATLTVFGLCTLAAIWHILAWDRAKAAGTEEAYQAQAMWPQKEVASILPHGSYVYVPYAPYKPHGGELRAKLLALQK